MDDEEMFEKIKSQREQALALIADLRKEIEDLHQSTLDRVKLMCSWAEMTWEHSLKTTVEDREKFLKSREDNDMDNDNSGKYRVVERTDGWFFVGHGIQLPCHDEAEGLEILYGEHDTIVITPFKKKGGDSYDE